jgi:hypothetical protein
MSWNPTEARACAAGRHRLLAVLAGCIAGLGAAGCAGDDPACTSSYDRLTALLEVRDSDGPCTECAAEGGLTITLGLANSCAQTAQFTTPESCVAQEFLLVTESGEARPASLGCFSAVTEHELQPGEVKTGTRTWGGSADDLSGAWGALEPGRYRLRLTMATDLMTDSELAPPVETEIVVTAR